MKKVNRYARRYALKRLREKNSFDSPLAISTEEAVATLSLLLAIGIQEYMEQKGIDKCEYSLDAKTKGYSPSNSLNPLS